MRKKCFQILLNDKKTPYGIVLVCDNTASYCACGCCFVISGRNQVCIYRRSVLSMNWIWMDHTLGVCYYFTNFFWRPMQTKRMSEPKKIVCFWRFFHNSKRSLEWERMCDGFLCANICIRYHAYWMLLNATWNDCIFAGAAACCCCCSFMFVLFSFPSSSNSFYSSFEWV